MREFSIECNGTKHFYSLVRVLNSQIGFGRWTTKGRPIRKLRRLDVSNGFRNRYGMLKGGQAMAITFMVPNEHGDITTALGLWGDRDGTR